MTRLSLRGLVVLAALGIGVHAGCAARPGLPSLPPLNDPATDARLPGKFVWADMFSSDVSGARRFYGELFSWDWRWVSERSGKQYGIFSNDGVAVAGLAQVPAPDAQETYARWVHYISVEDVPAAVSGVEGLGGRVMVSPHDIAQRGEFAVLADAEDAPFGVLRSSSGDPADFRAEIGQWLWIGLFARDAPAASKFYGALFGYEVFSREDDSEVLDYVLVENGYSRAGIAQLGAASEAEPVWLGYVRVDDLAAALDKVRALGGEVLWESGGDDPRGELAIVEDPFGAPIGLMRWTFSEPDEARAKARP
jgi:predicted enzyme related to lactoylglutathione lyase